MNEILTIKNLSLQAGVSHRYILQELNLQIASKQIIGVLGLNGSGKSSLLSAIAGVKNITLGNIALEKKLIVKYSAFELAKVRSYIQQEQLIKIRQKVWDYCLASLYAINEKSLECYLDKLQYLLEYFHLSPKTNSFLLELSGGELKRLALVVGLLKNVGLYILDEPTNHLDLPHINALTNYVLQYSENFTAAFMIASHDLQFILKTATHVLMLLPNGDYIFGNKTTVVSQQNLSKLYNANVSLKKSFSWKIQQKI